MRVRLLTVFVLAACGKEPKPAPPPPAEPKQVVAAKAAKLVDLLRFTPSVVAVSSKVDNPKDFPEHIVDGRPETAWNGKTGDLVGGWIAFRVPDDAVVKRVELTAGFDKKDLFEKNVRITRVRITKAGRTIREATLDPNVRTMQSIDVDEPGGDMRIEVLAVAAGTRADYKELCVSEIAVIGLPGATRYDAPVLPRVFVGSLDGPSSIERANGHVTLAAAGPYATPEAFCEAQKKGAAPGLARIWGSGERYPGKIDPACGTSKLEVTPKLAGAFEDALAYDANEPEYAVSGVLLKTERGWFRTPWIRSIQHYDDPGCLHAGFSKMLELTVPDASVPVVWMKYAEGDTYWTQVIDEPDGGYTAASWSTWLDRLEVCRVEPGTRVVACDESRELGKARVDEGDPEFFQHHARPYRPKTPRLGDAGSIELL